MTVYNRIAAQDLGRIAALSDGIFAFAMTVLVLEIHIPESADIHSEAQLWAGLAALAPRIVTWLLSLMTLGIFWVGQQTHLNHVAHADRDLTWLNYLFLTFVTALPFSTRLLAEFIGYETAFIVYWFNILLCGLSILACVIYAERAGLIKADAPAHFSQAYRRRVIVAQALYALGAALGLISIPLGIGFIVLVQLNYAIAPRLPVLFKL
ncbi:TMEM175 family protein [Methylocapsa sp. S129]|uniref:TMEM175 family protein n=1 Tax=Methylocapsa sp. S129 TaxID=1641869 RepID=UPI00131B36F0|nr:TMEM175 family protein [Methylocapsa sp. S129]